MTHAVSTGGECVGEALLERPERGFADDVIVGGLGAVADVAARKLGERGYELLWTVQMSHCGLERLQELGALLRYAGSAQG